MPTVVRDVAVGGKDAPGSFSTFIVSTNLAKEDSDTRKLIRSHVMRGKNKGKKMPRRPKPKSKDDSPPQSTPQQSRPGRAPERMSSDDTEHGWELIPAQKVASELSLWGFTSELRPLERRYIHEAYTVVKPAIYASQVFGNGSAYNDIFCFANLSVHPAMIPSLLFTVHSFQAAVRGLPTQGAGQSYLTKALHLLQRSLNDRESSTSYSTMVVVASLATAALIAGDLETTRKHMDGLTKMLQLRGGLKSLGSRSMISFKAQAIDVGLFMATGSETRFPQPESWSPQFADRRAASKFPELDMIRPRPDPRLLNIWADLRELSRLANLAVTAMQPLSPDDFASVSIAIPHRLRQLQGQYEPSSPPELLRLCMIAFTKTLLVRIGGFGRTMTHLRDSLETSICMQLSGDQSLLLWALLIAAMSVFEDMPREPYWLKTSLMETIAKLDLRNWPDTRSVLKRFLWVDSIHDESAKLLFDELFGVIIQQRGIKTVSPAELMIS